MSTELMTIAYRNRRYVEKDLLELTVYYEALPRMCPVDEIDFGILVGQHHAIDAGMKPIGIENYPTWELWTMNCLPRNTAVQLPVYVYEKDGRYHISTSKVPEEWNWVQFGYYYVTTEELKERFQRRTTSKLMKVAMEKRMKKYLTFMEAWLNNDVVEYVAKINDKIVSCQCGFFITNNLNETLQEIKEHACEEGDKRFELLV